LYFAAVFLFFSVIFSVAYFTFLKESPSCFDGLKNQDEIDADCGGRCKKVCATEAAPLAKSWTRLFKVGDGQYEVAALIENPNFALGVEELDYTFRLYDADGLFVAEKGGRAFVNSRDKFIIFESGLDTGKRIPVKAFVNFDSNMVWSRIDPKISRIPISVLNQEFVEGPMPRLRAEVINNSIYDLVNIVITAVVYNEDDNAVAASQTLVDNLKKGMTRGISFTWPRPISTVHPRVEIYPRVNLLNGVE